MWVMRECKGDECALPYLVKFGILGPYSATDLDLLQPIC